MLASAAHAQGRSACAAEALGEFPIDTFKALERAQLITLDAELNAYILDVDGIPGACSFTFASRWREAMRCAKEWVDYCLVQLNTGMTDAVRKVLDGHGDWRPLGVTCNLHFDGAECRSVAVTTTPGMFSRGSLKRQVLDEQYLNALSDEALCSAALHEMFHWAGRGHSNPTGNDGTDYIYACGRYCAACQAPERGMEDCLSCAESQDTKAHCGIGVEVVVDGPPTSGTFDNTCGSNGTCTAYRYGRFMACDKTRLPSFLYPPDWPGNPQCCQNCTAPQGDACLGALQPGWYPCTDPPPLCRGDGNTCGIEPICLPKPGH
ncbi:MAG: hypothetical protein ACKVPX_10005 [Myxococcaceae bacterium]